MAACKPAGPERMMMTLWTSGDMESLLRCVLGPEQGRRGRSSRRSGFVVVRRDAAGEAKADDAAEGEQRADDGVRGPHVLLAEGAVGQVRVEKAAEADDAQHQRRHAQRDGEQAVG